MIPFGNQMLDIASGSLPPDIFPVATDKRSELLSTEAR